ncbi:MAG: hypothetical protein MUD07_06280, partial [Burkholderiaceae bacterium]|nr:hypothetical protein [Burkholderiaceae bacterium]
LVRVARPDGAQEVGDSGVVQAGVSVAAGCYLMGSVDRIGPNCRAWRADRVRQWMTLPTGRDGDTGHGHRLDGRCAE